MKPSRRAPLLLRPPVLAGLAAAAALLLAGGCAVTRLQTSAELAQASAPFEAHPPRPVHRLLVVGDSTAVGTGASTPGHSVAGQIGRDHPDWRIDNRARNGARFADVLEQLQPGERYDTVLVLAGGNDVIRWTGEDTLRAQIGETARRAAALAPRVVWMPPGNVGNAPFFHAPLTWWMSSRSRMLHTIVRETVAATGGQYVNLYQARETDPFAQQPDRMNAADGLHPSDAGYRLWYEALQAQAPL